MQLDAERVARGNIAQLADIEPIPGVVTGAPGHISGTNAYVGAARHFFQKCWYVGRVMRQVAIHGHDDVIGMMTGVSEGQKMCRAKAELALANQYRELR